MKDMGELKSFLGIDITRNKKERTITLSQKGYVDTILNHFGFAEAAPIRTPMVVQKLEGLEANDKAFNPRKEAYCSLVGSLMYLMIATRPDLANAIGIISRYLSNPSEEHYKTVKHILCYVKGTKNYALMLGPGDKLFSLYSYADADFSNNDRRKLTTGYFFFISKGAMS